MSAQVVPLPVVLRPGRYWADLTESELDAWEHWAHREIAAGRAKLLRLASTFGEKDWWALFHVLERGAAYPPGLEPPEPSPRRVLVVEPPPVEARKATKVNRRPLADANRLALRAVALSSIAVLHFVARQH